MNYICPFCFEILKFYRDDLYVGQNHYCPIIKDYEFHFSRSKEIKNEIYLASSKLIIFKELKTKFLEYIHEDRLIFTFNFFNKNYDKILIIDYVKEDFNNFDLKTWREEILLFI